MKNIMENIKLTVSMIIIGAILLYIGTTIFMPELTIKFFGFKPYIVVTESMEPYLNVNDVVIATRFDADEAEVGDIITFKADIDYNGTMEVVTHYIYEIDRTGEETIIRTNRYFEDGETIVPDTWLIPSDNVIGSMGYKIPYLGLVIEFVKSFYGIAVIVLNVAIIVTIKYIKKKENSKLEVSQTQTIDKDKQVTT